ncbi:YajQ family cyclic di-GMP-binding protein [Halalkalibaculum sp. DA3122]|uniref:YajQ family cyclic di-GMP-binding protein n=1 Tax=unclassified Halalkalibaculum TaxID=2964617 RepID=UPI00375429AF
MPSFDIVNKIDVQEIDNAVNNTLKEVNGRYDFRGLHTEVIFNKKDHSIRLVADDNMKMNAVKEMLTRNAIKRGISPKVLQFSPLEGTSKGHLKMEIPIREGIDRDTAKTIVKAIKSLNLKVQPAIQDDQIRVSGKKIDDLQAVIRHLKGLDLDVPLQFTNMK